jgi:hypothetical protein
MCYAGPTPNSLAKTHLEIKMAYMCMHGYLLINHSGSQVKL